MEYRAPFIMSVLLIAGMLVASWWAWPLIPDAAPIAVHWNLDNVPNGFMTKDVALLLMPATAALLTLFFAVAPAFTKRRANLARSSTLYVTGWVGTVLLLFVGHVLVILHARGFAIDVTADTTFLLALFFVVIGNFLGKTRPNPYAGVRTKWTRKSDYSWDKTNRAAGKMIVAAGLASLATFAVAGSRAAGIVLIVCILVATAISVVLSYIYFKRDPELGAGDGGLK